MAELGLEGALHVDFGEDAEALFGQRLAGPNTFAALTSMSDEDWAQARERSKAASDTAKAQRSV